MSRFVLLLACAMMLAGCDAFSTVTEGFTQSKAVAADLEQSTGVKPQVGFNWHNGRLVSVTVQFPRPYEDKPLNELAGLVREAVTSEFKQTPEHIVVAFVLVK
ncbi:MULTISPECIES: hypothetical protein [Bradyrhizobium]|uniref:Uncharacterized protein n=1 Tax=Bradyrhizobium stylosanthis TaxID=1803665 RepID=A0A560DGL2_9BRAD|nr:MULTISPECIES: hypothetical protein [Bradyrhizobium]MBR1179089.1 hypothetical protein [Bradyrhizobium sp. KB893862 SZCCT0404]TWA96212.1 hypothetical protein FBZ96_107406 [Bradyrhizobium stylosanthis]